MNQYVTGSMIRRLREEKKMTQSQLAEKMNVSDKAISKWETGRGYPDITMIEKLSDVLGVSIIELFSGEDITNTNRSFNMLKTKLYVCPICRNLIQSIGEALVSCHGIVLPALEAEEENKDHHLQIEKIEDEYYVKIDHEMEKDHYISFIMAVKDDGYELRKLYPQGRADAYFKISGTKYFMYYCNRHGLFKKTIR